MWPPAGDNLRKLSNTAIARKPAQA